MTRKQERVKFIEVWQSSESLPEVANRLGLTERQVINKASYYRTRLGIPLKKFRSISNQELQELRKLVKDDHETTA